MRTRLDHTKEAALQAALADVQATVTVGGVADQLFRIEIGAFQQPSLLGPVSDGFLIRNGAWLGALE